MSSEVGEEEGEVDAVASGWLALVDGPTDCNHPRSCSAMRLALAGRRAEGS
jgi:hypothetical protein